MLIQSKNISAKNIKDALKIYNYYITNSFSNFEEKKLTLKSFKFLIQKIKRNKLPFIVAIDNQTVVGLAFVNKFREKSGYRYSYEHSIYINQNFLNNKFGSKLLKELINQCKKNKNIKNLIAVIGGSDNIASIKIHKKNGFKNIGTIIKAGYKKRRWIDSIYMQKRLWKK